MLRRSLCSAGLLVSVAAEESPGGNCTAASVDVLYAPETGLSACADVVAYFSLKAGTQSVMAPNRTFTTQLNGFNLRFVSAHNKALFDEDPWAFAPAYGGF